MRILDRNIYGGPSQFALFPVIRLELDLEELENWPTAKIGQEFVDGLIEALPGLNSHGCSYREAGGFVRRMREDEGTWMGHVLEHLALELQNVAGEYVTFGKTRQVRDGREGVYNVIYEYETKEEGIAAGELAMQLIDSLLPANLKTPGLVPEDWTWAEALENFIRYAQRRALGPSTASLVRAAKRRKIPWMRLNQNSSLIQLGHGKYQQRIQATVTGRTSHIAVELASDKEETNKILGALGLPVPRQRLVQTADAAVNAAAQLGGSVVLKPYNGNHGRGITIDIREEADIRAAFEEAHQISNSVIVETFQPGCDHRMLVVNGELVAATLRTPGCVVGDGESTVSQLLDVLNSNPDRGVGHEKILTQIKLDREAFDMLGRVGMDEHSVPAAGQIVQLRATANLSTGGTATDVLDIVHPDNRSMAERAVQAIGLDVGGVDFITPNIAESYKSAGGAICEINAAPGFRMHVSPSEGTPRDVAGPVVDMLFPQGAASTVPITAITGTNGKTTTARMVAHIAKMAGFTPGLTTTDGVYIDGHRTVEGDMTGPVSAQMVLRDPTIDFAVLETARGGMVRAGMGVPKVDVGAVINVASDHLGLKGVNTLEQLAEIKRIVVEVAKDCAVLNADDPLVVRMSGYTDAKVICYVTMDPANTFVRDHVRSGGRACALEEGVNGEMITIYDQGKHIPLLWTHLVQSTLEGQARHNVQNAMMAAAITYSMGIKLDAIRQGLRTFDTSFVQAPGRLNVFSKLPFKVIMDYGHNAHAVSMMADLAKRIDVNGRRIVVLSGPGDRRDEDLRELANAVSGVFAHYILKRDDNRRGRGHDEVPQIMAAALRESGIADSAITIVPEEVEAVDTALTMAEKGDLVMIFADALARTWKQITKFGIGGDEGYEAARGGAVEALAPTSLDPAEDHAYDATEMQGMVRDDRGLHYTRMDEESD